MNVMIKRVMMIFSITIAVLLIIVNATQKPQIRNIDMSNMGGEVPMKAVSLNHNISLNEGRELAYILSEEGNIYILQNTAEKYYVELWQPEFWNGTKIKDLCVADIVSYALALDQDGNVYLWNKENAENNRNIRAIENIPKISEIFATYNQFVLVSEDKNVYRWYLKDNLSPKIEDLQRIDMDESILNVAATQDELFVLDENSVLWSIENTEGAVPKYLETGVKGIKQSVRGFVVQLMNNEIYVHCSYILARGYETRIFANRYEAACPMFKGDIALLAVSNDTAIVCIDGEELYRWGTKGSLNAFGTCCPGIRTYTEPVKVQIPKPEYCTLVGDDLIYTDNQNNMFILFQN